jgi:hypothetical protein
MLRINTHHKSRISNRLAIFAAVLLLVSSLAGMGNPIGPESGAMKALAAADSAIPALSSKSSTKAFKISLFLFRNN